MRSPAQLLLVLLAAFVILAPRACCRAESPGEYDIKAALIYKLLPFVTWPDTDETPSSLTIGVVGKNPFGDTLREIEGRRIGSRSLVVRHFDTNADIAQLKRCQVLFLADADEENLRRILQAVSSWPILTIGDCPGFVDRGGVIGFVTRERRVAFEINQSAMAKASLAVRSQLMRLAARIVDTDPPTGEDTRE
ncbi:MAG: YfiR family protein [Lentisphaeria bacterium]|nr:YfiR family protein [Lentisphaeria bacterium]